jgi:hypothetical protein
MFHGNVVRKSVESYGLPEAGHAVAGSISGACVRAMICRSEGYHGAVEGPNIHIELAEHFAEGTEQALRNFMLSPRRDRGAAPA